MPLTTIAAFEAQTGTDAPTPAETALIAACRTGLPCDLGARPSVATPDRTIRADLLRLLIIGGTTECGLDQVGVWLQGAWIEGMLDLRHATARGQTVLHACTFLAQPRLGQANLKLLSLDDSDLRQGLFAQQMTVAGSVLLRNVTATGTVDVMGAAVGGQLVCDRATFVGPMVDGKRGKALDAQGVQVTGSLFLSNITATGTVDVNGATIGGQLSCDSATLVGPIVNGERGMALLAQDVQVTAHLFLRNVTATGMVAVNAATVGGQLNCDSSTFNGAGGRALNAQSVQVTAGLFLSNVTATGTIDVSGATVGGQLVCDRATFVGPMVDGKRGEALDAQGVQVTAGLFLRNLTATGTVDVNGATVGGQLDCTGATLDGAGQIAFDATRLEVKKGFVWCGRKPVKGRVDLTAAHVGDLMDDAASWPRNPDMLGLVGFTYDRIVGLPTDPAMRLEWLRRGSRYRGTFYPQPYVHLARVLRGMGHEAGARDVLVELGTLSRAQARKAAMGPQAGKVRGAMRLLNPFRVVWDFMEWLLIGYGHRPINAVFALLILWGAATWLAGRTWDEGSFAPNSATVLTSPGWTGLLAIDCIGDMPDPLPPGVTACDRNPADTWSARAAAGMDWDSFSPWGYGIDLVVPILNLGQTDAWAPSRDRGPMGWWLWWGRWVLIGAGWLVSALGVAAITGIMQRNQPGVT